MPKIIREIAPNIHVIYKQKQIKKLFIACARHLKYNTLFDNNNKERKYLSYSRRLRKTPQIIKVNKSGLFWTKEVNHNISRQALLYLNIIRGLSKIMSINLFIFLSNFRVSCVNIHFK